MNSGLSSHQSGAHLHHARQVGGSPPDSRRELASERIAFLRHVIALLESPGTSRTGDCADHLFPGQLKTLFTGPSLESRVHAASDRLKAELPTSRVPELPVASDVAVPWDIAYFIEHLRPQLPPGACGEPVESAADFLTALVAAMNDHAKLPDLDRFPEWRDAAPSPLE